MSAMQAASVVWVFMLCATDHFGSAFSPLCVWTKTEVCSNVSLPENQNVWGYCKIMIDGAPLNMYLRPKGANGDVYCVEEKQNEIYIKLCENDFSCEYFKDQIFRHEFINNTSVLINRNIFDVYEITGHISNGNDSDKMECIRDDPSLYCKWDPNEECGLVIFPQITRLSTCKISITDDKGIIKITFSPHMNVGVHICSGGENNIQIHTNNNSFITCGCEYIEVSQLIHKKFKAPQTVYIDEDVFDDVKINIHVSDGEENAVICDNESNKKALAVGTFLGIASILLMVTIALICLVKRFKRTKHRGDGLGHIPDSSSPTSPDVGQSLPADIVFFKDDKSNGGEPQPVSLGEQMKSVGETTVTPIYAVPDKSGITKMIENDLYAGSIITKDSQSAIFD